MAAIYARWIAEKKVKNGKVFTIDRVPSRWQEETRQVLKDKYNIEV